MNTLRIHYYWRQMQARCGHPQYQNITIDPKRVTCETCKKLMGKELQS